ASAAVEIDRVHHQSVAIPGSDGIAEPRGDLVAMLASVDGDQLEPGVLLVQERQVFVALHDLDGIGGIHGANQAEGQAGAGIVALRHIVGVKRRFGLGPEREFGFAFLIAAFAALGHVGYVGALPKTAEIGLAPEILGRGALRRTVALPAALSFTLARAVLRDSRSECHDCQSHGCRTTHNGTIQTILHVKSPSLPRRDTLSGAYCFNQLKAPT